MSAIFEEMSAKFLCLYQKKRVDMSYCSLLYSMLLYISLSLCTLSCMQTKFARPHKILYLLYFSSCLYSCSSSVSNIRLECLASTQFVKSRSWSQHLCLLSIKDDPLHSQKNISLRSPILVGRSIKSFRQKTKREKLSPNFILSDMIVTLILISRRTTNLLFS